MHRRLLVPDQHMFEFVLPENGIVDFQHRAAGVAENEFDTFFLQAADNRFRARYLHIASLSLC